MVSFFLISLSALPFLTVQSALLWKTFQGKPKDPGQHPTNPQATKENIGFNPFKITPSPSPPFIHHSFFEVAYRRHAPIGSQRTIREAAWERPSLAEGLIMDQARAGSKPP